MMQRVCGVSNSKMDSEMICQKCNESVVERPARFCPNCGTEIISPDNILKRRLKKAGGVLVASAAGAVLLAWAARAVLLVCSVFGELL